jgi:hypothetical protein
VECSTLKALLEEMLLLREHNSRGLSVVPCASEGAERRGGVLCVALKPPGMKTLASHAFVPRLCSLLVGEASLVER